MSSIRPFINSLILLCAFSSVKTEYFGCNKLFSKQHTYFSFYSEPIIQTPIVRDVDIPRTSNFGSDKNGVVKASICDKVVIPSSCPTFHTKAKFVWQNKNKPSDCIIVDGSADWTFSLNKNDNEPQTVEIKNNSKTENLMQYTFVCEEGNDKPTVDVLYHPETKMFEVRVSSRDGCGLKLGLMEFFANNPILTGILLCGLGITLCYFGLKCYEDLLFFFGLVVICLLGFYMYLAVVQSGLTGSDRFNLVLFFLAVLVIVGCLIITMPEIILGVLTVVASYNLHTMLMDFLVRQDIKLSFKEEYFVLMTIIILSLCFLIGFQEYFTILLTAVMGSSLIIMSLPYFGLTQFNFINDLSFSKFKHFEEMEPSYFNVMMVFMGLFITGLVCQIVEYHLRKDDEEEYEHDEEMNDSHLYA